MIGKLTALVACGISIPVLKIEMPAFVLSSARLPRPFVLICLHATVMARPENISILHVGFTGFILRYVANVWVGVPLFSRHGNSWLRPPMPK